MVHVLIVVRPVHIQTHVMVIILTTRAHQLVQHVPAVPAGRAQQLVHVRAGQSASHVILDTTCPMVHV